MVGAYKIRVHNNSGSYTFELKRNLTVLRGSSGRGKTTLYDMIRDYNRYGKNSGVSVSCDRDIFALDDKNWADFIEKHPGSIIVIDEDNEYIRSTDFARIVKGSDNYFLLITRCYLANLPISVDEIYELTGNKNNKLVRIYTDENRMFNKPYIGRLPFIPEVIITEDSNSGFQFFNAIAKENNIKCISAEGKSNIFDILNGYPDKNVVVIADGAAFGAEIEMITGQQLLRPNKIAIFLPESFEWLLLKSGVVDVPDNDRVDNAEQYADSKLFMSWEQYFSQYIQKITSKKAYMKYSKKKLKEYYLNDKNVEKVKGVIKGIRL